MIEIANDRRPSQVLTLLLEALLEALPSYLPSIYILQESALIEEGRQGDDGDSNISRKITLNGLVSVYDHDIDMDHDVAVSIPHNLDKEEREVLFKPHRLSLGEGVVGECVRDGKCGFYIDYNSTTSHVSVPNDEYGTHRDVYASPAPPIAPTQNTPMGHSASRLTFDTALAVAHYDITAPPMSVQELDTVMNEMPSPSSQSKGHMRGKPSKPNKGDKSGKGKTRRGSASKDMEKEKEKEKEKGDESKSVAKTLFGIVQTTSEMGSGDKGGESSNQSKQRSIRPPSSPLPHDRRASLSSRMSLSISQMSRTPPPPALAAAAIAATTTNTSDNHNPNPTHTSHNMSASRSSTNGGETVKDKESVEAFVLPLYFEQVIVGAICLTAVHGNDDNQGVWEYTNIKSVDHSQMHTHTKHHELQKEEEEDVTALVLNYAALTMGWDVPVSALFSSLVYTTIDVIATYFASSTKDLIFDRIITAQREKEKEEQSRNANNINTSHVKTKEKDSKQHSEKQRRKSNVYETLSSLNRSQLGHDKEKEKEKEMEKGQGKGNSKRKGHHGHLLDRYKELSNLSSRRQLLDELQRSLQDQQRTYEGKETEYQVLITELNGTIDSLTAENTILKNHNEVNSSRSDTLQGHYESIIEEGQKEVESMRMELMQVQGQLEEKEKHVDEMSLKLRQLQKKNEDMQVQMQRQTIELKEKQQVKEEVGALRDNLGDIHSTLKAASAMLSGQDYYHTETLDDENHQNYYYHDNQEGDIVEGDERA